MSIFNVTTKAMRRLIIAACCFLTTFIHAQTVLVSPTGNGGFELGSGSFVDNGWTLVNNTNTVANKWYTGIGFTSGGYTFPSATRCAYVSGNDGTNWSYTTTNPASVHFYRDVIVPAGETNVSLSFKFQQNGVTNAKLIVYACPITLTPVVGQPTNGSVNIGTNGWGTVGLPVRLLNTLTPQIFGTVTYNATIPADLINACSSTNSFRLVFTWNSSTTIGDPPAAVDEISVVSYPATPLSTVGAYTINNSLPNAGNNFNSIAKAISWLNAAGQCGINNPITFNIAAGQTFNEDLPAITATGTLANPIVFQKSGAGANPVLTPVGFSAAGSATAQNEDFGVCISGGDYITFDGLDIIANNAMVEYGYLIRNASATNGATNNIIKNTTVILDRTNITSRGFLQTESTAGSGFSASSISGVNSNNKFLNFTIGNVYSGILVLGSSDGTRYTGLTIGTTSNQIFNQIGRANVPNDIGNGASQAYGICVSYAENIELFNTRITNVTAATTVDGIILAGAAGNFGGLTGANGKIYNNIISNIRQSNATSTSTVCAMRILHYNIAQNVNIKIFNNVIHNITSAYTGAISNVRSIKGIFLPFATAIALPNAVTYEIVNNSIVIDGSSSPNISSIAYESNTSMPTFIIRNNLFANLTGAQTGAAVHFGMGTFFTSAALATAQGGINKLGNTGSLSNYNNVFIANATNGHYGAYTTTSNVITPLSALTNWQANYTSPAHDANSISANPILNSSTLLVPFFGSPLGGAFPSLPSPYHLDILGTTRSLANSTIGAYETVRDAIAPTMNDTTLVNVYTTTNRTLTALLTISDNSQLSVTPGLAPRIYFKKSTNANVFGANNSTANGWKWIEATNTTSPFDFTIDYSLLTGGAATTNDTIQYFYLAQDTLTIPNITVYPATGFVGTTVANVTQAPTTPKQFTIFGTPAAYVDAVVSQGKTTKVEQGSVTNQVIRIAVQIAPTGAPAYINELVLNAAGINDFSNIANAKIWFTGSNPNFSAINQFGATHVFGAGSGPIGNFTIAGSQLVPNGISYFWLTYDIKSTANANDSVDASLVSITYNGTTQTPTVATAAGQRIIKTAYCIPAITSGNYCISNVQFNTLYNTSGGCGTVFYSNYEPVNAATTSLVKGSQYNLAVTINSASAKVFAMFDFNDDGDFNDVGETIQIATNSAVNVPIVFPVTIPCSAVGSELRMRIRSANTSVSLPDVACSGSVSSEVEDYTVTLTENVVGVTSSAVAQTNTIASTNSTNVKIARLAFTASGCGVGTFNELRCNTADTDNPTTNIINAKLYATRNTNIFNTSKLLATVVAPNGAFTFTGFIDTISSTPGDTNNYWIAYDVSPAANVNDTLDVRIDSMLVAGSYSIPTPNNPAQYLVIKTPMTYVSSTVTHPNLSRVAQGSRNIQVLKINVVTSPTGGPVQLTQFNLSTIGGGADTLNIDNVKIFYTGNTNAFDSINQFGLTYNGNNGTALTWPPYAVNGIQPLSNGNNYFWVTYNLKATAVVFDSVDATLASFDIGGITQTPTTPTTNGNIVIRAPYCASVAASISFEEIFNVTFGSINNTSACGQTGGGNSVMFRYSDYSANAPATVLKGISMPFSITTGSCGSQINDRVLIFVDWNQNGLFTDAGETVYTSAIYNTSGSSNAPVILTGSFTIPCNAVLGETRMRVLLNGQGTGILPCTNVNYSYGETEDYTLIVAENQISVVSAEPKQVNSFVASGSFNNMVMRVPLKAQGCGTGALESMYFATNGTTNNADIALAKLYYTGNVNSFNTNNLLGSTSVVGGKIIFTSLNTTLLSSPTDTNNFWLAYDINPSAANSNIVDARLDSVGAIGIYIKPVTGNPVGNALVSPYMTQLATIVSQNDLSAVGRPSPNKQILKVAIITSSTGAPALLSELNFNTIGGGNDALNIDSARVYFTGNTSVFNTAIPFGNAFRSISSPSWGTFTITGNQLLVNDTNYFWLAYDVKSTGVIGDSLDAQFVSSQINTVNYAPVNGNPAGRILIRQDYCASASTSLNNRIGRVVIGSIDNTTPCATQYSNFTTIASPSVKKSSVTPLAITNMYCTGLLPDYAGYFTVFIDYNQDGDFSDAGETVAISSLISNNVTFNTNITPPCGALTGETRMRIILSTSNTVSSCGTYASYGETEDYTINITNNPQAYISSVASQTGGLVNSGVNEVMMNIKVKASGCGLGDVSAMYFNTVGSTSPANDIVSAKLYATGNSTTFSNSNLLGTVSNPNGQFSFAFSNLLLGSANDSNNYWLVYEISQFAGLNNILDVRIDSVTVLGENKVPVNNSPSQSKTINYPLLYNSSTVQQLANDRVTQGTTAQVLRIDVVTSSVGSPINLTQINLNTNGGGIDSANMLAAKIYYTGNSKTFATTNQFGNTYPTVLPTTPQWPAYSINGTQALVADTNYFWLVYDIKPTAIVGDSVDAEVVSIVVAGVTQTPTVTAPTGKALIRSEYCIPSPVSGGRCITNVTFGTINSSSTASCTSPYFTLYPLSTTTNVYRGATLPIQVTAQTNTYMVMFIDFNRNGIFTDIGEQFDLSTTSLNTTVTFPVTIPVNALLGETRMRVRSYNIAVGAPVSLACDAYNNAETEDYIITIMPEIPPTTYVWNKTAAADFGTPSNWTPARVAATQNDRLIFGTTSPSTIVVNNMYNQTNATIEVMPDTKLSLNAASATTLVIKDTLILGANAVINVPATTMQVGTSSNTTGTIISASLAGIKGTLTRWIGASNANNVVFPLCDLNGTNRSVTMGYTTLPSTYGAVTAKFNVAASPGAAGLPLTDAIASVNINKISPAGYWDVTAANGLSGGSYTGSFAVDSFGGIISPFQLVLVNRVDQFNNWGLNGTYATAIGTQTNAIVIRTSMTAFGQFAIGSDSAINLLPVSLLTFNAINNKGNINLAWRTASENNNAGFMVERSVDGKTFTRIAFVPSSSNLNTINYYTFNDNRAFENAFSQQLYYRLKQVDKNGSYAYSTVVSVSQQQFGEISLYPNPFNDVLNIVLPKDNAQPVEIIINDAHGKEMFASTINVSQQANNMISLTNFNTLATGIYFVKVSVGNTTQMFSVVKQ